MLLLTLAIGVDVTVVVRVELLVDIHPALGFLDDMPDESAAIAEILEDVELLRALYAKLNELDPEGRLICQLVMQGKSERELRQGNGTLLQHLCIS